MQSQTPLSEAPMILGSNTVDGRNPANQLRLVGYPMIYKDFYIPGGWEWDFWTINSSNGVFSEGLALGSPNLKQNCTIQL